MQQQNVFKVKKNSGEHLHERSDAQDVIIPATIHDVIMARVDTLPEAAKAVLQMEDKKAAERL